MASTLEILTAAQMAFLMNKPTAMMYQTSNQGVGSGAYTAITYNVAVDDNWGGWSSGANSQYTVQVAGVYEVCHAVQWTGNSSGNRFQVVAKNGTEINGSKVEIPGSSAGAAQSVIGPTVVVSAVVGDTFQILATQTSGGTLNTYASDPYCYMSVKFLHF